MKENLRIPEYFDLRRTNAVAKKMSAVGGVESGDPGESEDARKEGSRQADEGRSRAGVS